MAQWYCVIDGKEDGPHSREDILTMIQDGRIGAADLVWKTGMDQWVAAAVALPEAFEGKTVMGCSADGLIPVMGYSTGGPSPNEDLTARAREALAGRWWPAVGFCLLISLINVVVQNLPGIGGLASLVIGGALQFSTVVYFLTLCRGGDPKVGLLSTGFNHFGAALGTHLLTALFILGWSLLLIVPGIIASYAYSQAMYILVADPSIGSLEAIRRSKAMMDGYKWKLACLHFRFFGWSLLCVLTLGIGMLWLVPYVQASLAAFHDDLPKTGETVIADA